MANCPCFTAVEDAGSGSKRQTAPVLRTAECAISTRFTYELYLRQVRPNRCVSRHDPAGFQLLESRFARKKRIGGPDGRQLGPLSRVRSRHSRVAVSLGPLADD